MKQQPRFDKKKPHDLLNRGTADAELWQSHCENMTLETTHLILRPWSEDDAQELYKYASDPEVGEPAGWPPHTSVENSREIIRSILSKPEIFAICTKDNKPIGNIHLDFSSDKTDRADECELGFWLGRPFWGQGIICEAAEAVIFRAFSVLGANAVLCAYFNGNARSRRVQEKLGFVQHHAIERTADKRVVHVTLLTREMWEDIKTTRNGI